MQLHLSCIDNHEKIDTNKVFIATPIKVDIPKDPLKQQECDQIVYVFINEKKTLELSLLLTEDVMAPLFSGAAWAGSIIWDSAIVLANYIYQFYKKDLLDATVIELGAGIGLPSMIASIMGSKNVYATEQADLIPLLKENKKNNEPIQSALKIVELSWGHEGVETFLSSTGVSSKSIDLILCCDCIYEPLYGENWKDLLLTIDRLLYSKNAHCLLSVERRNGDGVENFLSLLSSSTNLCVDPIKFSSHSKTNWSKIELYQIGRE